MMHTFSDHGDTPGMTARSLADAASSVRPLDEDARSEADARTRTLAKPPGALGRLESLGSQLAAIRGTCPPPVPAHPVVCVFAGDHGVLAQGVSPWPQEVTAQMVGAICAGGAAINVLARQVGAHVQVIDVGVATPIGAPRSSEHAGVLLHRKVRCGTGDLATGPAMSLVEAQAALDVGAGVAADAVAAGADLLITGEMGIGNTTASAALIAAFTGLAPAEVTGRGTGIDDETLRLKVAVISRAVARLVADAAPLTVLAEVGGLEIAALAGLMVAGAAARVPVVVDGVIAASAALVACALVPAVRGYLIAGHLSAEPGAAAALEHLELRPLVDLELRLGEGTGAVLAVPLVQAAARVLGEMATLDEVTIGAP